MWNWKIQNAIAPIVMFDMFFKGDAPIISDLSPTIPDISMRHGEIMCNAHTDKSYKQPRCAERTANGNNSPRSHSSVMVVTQKDARHGGDWQNHAYGVRQSIAGN